MDNKELLIDLSKKSKSKNKTILLIGIEGETLDFIKKIKEQYPDAEITILEEDPEKTKDISSKYQDIKFVQEGFRYYRPKEKVYDTILSLKGLDDIKGPFETIKMYRKIKNFLNDDGFFGSYCNSSYKFPLFKMGFKDFPYIRIPQFSEGIISSYAPERTLEDSMMRDMTDNSYTDIVDQLLKEILVKTQITCYGIKPNEVSTEITDKLYKIQRTGNSGVQIRLKSGLLVNASIYQSFNKESPLEFSKDQEDKHYIHNAETGFNYPFEVQEIANWYSLDIGNGKKAYEYLEHESGTLIASITETCSYCCKFCGLNNNIDSKPHETYEQRAEHIKNALKAVLTQPNNKCLSINLTGGSTPLSGDRGLSKYLEFIQAIREVSNIPIAIELTPPKNTEDLKKLTEYKNVSIIMNIEINDKAYRDEIMPVKSKIPVSEYLKAYEVANEYAGKNNVGSAIIVNLEPPESTVEGIYKMIAEHCIPDVLAYKPNDGSKGKEISYNEGVCDPSTLLSVSLIDAFLLQHHGLSPEDKAGCIGCGACTLEGDLLNLLNLPQGRIENVINKLNKLCPKAVTELNGLLNNSNISNIIEDEDIKMQIEKLGQVVSAQIAQEKTV